MQKLLPESQGQNLALTVLWVPYSLDSGGVKGLDDEGLLLWGLGARDVGHRQCPIPGSVSAYRSPANMAHIRQILALAFRQISSKRFKLSPSRSEAVGREEGSYLRLIDFCISHF